MNPPLKVLFIETFKLGDLVYLGALLRTVREQAPEAEITVLCDDSAANFPFFAALGVRVVTYPFPWNKLFWHRSPGRLLSLGGELRRRFGRDFEDWIGLDARGDARHRWTLRQLGVRRRMTFRSPATWMQAQRGLHDEHTFVARQRFYRQIAGPLGMAPDVAMTWPWIAAASTPRADNAESPGRPWALLAPGASNSLKFWPEANWEALASGLRREGWRTMYVLSDGVGYPSDPGAYDEIWSGSIAELADQIDACEVVVGVDSFCGHLAAAIGIPVVSIFGPVLPSRWRPWGNRTSVVMADGFPCRPCNLKRCVLPGSSCMDAIEVGTVIAAVRHLVPATRQSVSPT